MFFQKPAVFASNVTQGQTKDIDVPLSLAESCDLRHIAFVIPDNAPIEAAAVRALPTGKRQHGSIGRARMSTRGCTSTKSPSE